MMKSWEPVLIELTSSLDGLPIALDGSDVYFLDQSREGTQVYLGLECEKYHSVKEGVAEILDRIKEARQERCS
jgi:hypothetical protein